MRGRTSRWSLLTLLACMVWTLFMTGQAQAEVPYDTFSRDSYDRTFRTQAAYQPVGILATDLYVQDPDNADQQVQLVLNNPQDLFIDARDEIYVADTGNNRIVHLNSEGALIRILDSADNPFRAPEGLFVDQEGKIYVADTGNRRIVLLDAEGNYIRDYTKPESRFIPASYPFDPFDLVVDRRGFMYVASKGSFQGLLLLDTEGEFQGFFGTNQTEAGIFDRIKLFIYSEEMLNRELRLLPNAIRGIAIDDTGFIYTTTLGTASEQIKKFNIRSENLLEEVVFGDYEQIRLQQLPQFISLAIDSNNNIIAIDRTTSAIEIYSEHGDLLFSWSGTVIPGQSQLGLIQSPSAIATNSANELFVLDASQNNIQRLRLSPFGELVFRAMNLMNQGNYEASVPYFEEIIRLNANFSPAYQGLGLAAFQRNEFALALEMFELAGDKEGYSEAFWQLRLSWFQANFSLMANGVLLVGAFMIAGSAWKRKRKYKFSWKFLKSRTGKLRLVDQLYHSLHILKHPIDGFSDLRQANKGGYLSALILLTLAVTTYLLNLFFTNFHFTGDRPVYEIRAGIEIMQFLLIWFSWVVGHYLVSTIYRGEGRFKDVFIGSAYALTPIVLLAIPVVLLSNTLSLSETSIYNFFLWSMYLWMAVLMFWKVQAIQNYGVGEAIINILLTLLTVIVMWVLIFIVSGLTAELFRFIFAIYQEVTMR